MRPQFFNAGSSRSVVHDPLGSSPGTSKPVEVPALAEQPPVRFANPFDKSEVFEFPAGTTRTQARAVVADLLLQRAMERQQSGDAQSR